MGLVQGPILTFSPDTLSEGPSPEGDVINPVVNGDRSVR
jgi:hypothetical protein